MMMMMMMMMMHDDWSGKPKGTEIKLLQRHFNNHKSHMKLLDINNIKYLKKYVLEENCS
jgi:hypothetical protein